MRFLKSLRLLSLLAISIALTVGCSDDKKTGEPADTGSAQSTDEGGVGAGTTQVAQVKFDVEGMT